MEVGSNVGWFSAASCLVGRDAHNALNGTVPIGLVASNWGGTDVEAWSSPEVFAKCDAGFAVVADVDCGGGAPSPTDAGFNDNANNMYHCFNIDIGGAVEGDRLIAFCNESAATSNLLAESC